MPFLGFRQHQVQKQVQALSQKQIISLSMLSQPTEELYDTVEKAAQENPAFSVTWLNGERTHLTSSAGKSAEHKSDNFQAVLESRADTRESLPHHLLTQLHSHNLTASETAFAEEVIYRLDSHGFLLFDPVSLLDKKDPSQTPALANKVISLIQGFDPCGCCTKNFQESLLVQAKLHPEPNALAVFILDGHFDFLNPPVSAQIQKKLSAYLNSQKKLFALKETAASLNIGISEIEKAVSFIKKLDPYPGTNYSTESTRFVEPDIYIEESEEYFPAEDFSKGIVIAGGKTFIIKTAWQNNLKVSVNPEYKKLASDRTLSKDDAKKIKAAVRQAEDLINSLSFRQNTLLEVMCLIVKKQHDFFIKESGTLNELKQKDIARLLGVHETTVSRMANSKYVQCQKGFFPVKYFFTNAVNSVSRDKILSEIKDIIESRKDAAERLSDQKLCSLLEERGIKIARRTVAKYRGLLNIESSFKR